MMKFRRDSDLEACGASIIHDSSGGVTEVACMRLEGHRGEHIAMMSTAAKADGVCHYCREDIPKHEDGCVVLEAKNEV
jgi:hypothetical protein